MEIPQGKPTLRDLQQAAREERWKFIDPVLPGLADDPIILGWSLGKGLRNKNGNLRDLAVSCLEKSAADLKLPVIRRLERMMDSDENRYVRFRAAFTLFNRGNRSTEVMQKIREALEDEDVKTIAKGYLAQLGIEL